LRESPPRALQPGNLLVLGEDGEWHEADLYRVAEPKGPYTPSRGYVKLMLAGARAHRLAPDYVKKIEEIYEKSR